eukprot:1192719-Prorocentrum_minimum.AAC.2
MLGHVHRIRQDGLVGVVGVLLVLRREGRVPAQHLVDEHAQGPQVHTLAVPLVHDDLRREVVRRAAERVGDAVGKLFAKAKVH